MKTLITDVTDFHRACDLPVHTQPRFVPERAALRSALLAEECQETVEALERGDMEKIADGLADVIYVAVGAALEFGIPLDRVWAEVHRSNMAKVDQATGKVVKRADGKVLKPEGWTPPDVAGVLAGRG
jgi:predicted HAD superfamily Cof-like phosphohydrolase